MGKRVSIFLVLMLLFQTITSSVFLPLQLHAEGSQQNIFTNMTLKDENGNEVQLAEEEAGTPIYVHVDWSIKDKDIMSGETESLLLPDGLYIDNDQQGFLTYDEVDIGEFQATDDKVIATFNDEATLHTEASGTLIVEATVDSEEVAVEEVTEEATEETDQASDKEDEEGTEEDNEAAETDGTDEADEDASEEKADEQKNQANAAIADQEPQQITENIIDDFKLIFEDGSEYQDGDFIEIGEDLRLELDWSLPNDHEYKSGDYFEFQLPNQLQVYNEVTGDLGNYGSYVVTTDGQVTFTFNENIEIDSNVNGDFWFDTELDEQEIKSTTEDLEIIYNDDVLEKITINVKPTGGQAIHKEGQPVDGSFNTEEIEWTVLINTTREALENAVVNDPILDGQELILDSIILQEVEVDLQGNVVEELGEVDVTNNSSIDELKLELGDTNKAYKLTFKTKIKEDEKDKEGWLWYENTAYLNSDGQEDKQSGAGVSVERPESLVKSSSAFDEEDRSVEWEVKANFTEKQLKADDTIVDEFTFKVGDKELNDVFEIIEEDIEILQVDSFDNKGNPDETTSAKDLFDITIDGNKVTYTLKEDTNKAFILKYKTQAKDGSYITDNGTIFNKVEIDGKTDESSQGVIQQVGKKTNAGIDYENKTIDWTITINADKQDLRGFVLTDDFAGSGQKLVDGSIEIEPDASGATITPNEDGEGFVIDFGDITDTYTITYQTKFTYDFEGEGTPNFENKVNISYETSDGDDYNLEIGDNVNPNEETRSNGAKNGTANNETKEITWTVDINYNQLVLENAKLIDEIAENQSLIDGSVKIFPTTIDKDGNITAGEATDEFAVSTDNDVITIDFGEIDQSYRVEFMTKDKDGVYNSDEVYENTAQFIPREGEKHNLTANVTLPNQGEFLGKEGLHNREDWTIDWEVDVNKSKSKLTDVKVKDDLGSTDAQILLEDSIKVTKEGSDEELVEGEDYEITVDGNELIVHFPGEITDHYKITYSSYIVAEEDADITNEAEIESVDEVIVGNTETTEIVQVKISTGGGSAEGETGGLIIEKVESGTDRPLEDVAFELVKEVGNQEIVVREGTTDANGKLEWKGLKFGDYTLNEVIPEGYLGEEEQTVTISSEDPEGIKTLTIENERETGTAQIVKVDAVTGEELEGAEFKLTNQTTGQTYTFTTDENGEVSEDVPFGEYTVEEVTAPNGYRVTEDIDNITVEIDETTEVEVTNEAIVDVAGEKTWIADADQELPESITVELLANGSKVDEKEVTAANDWTYSFTNLDKYDAEGNEIDYSIEEVALDGYVSEKDGYDLTNIQTIDITGDKTWVEVDEQYRPDSITVNLLANEDEEPVKTVEVSAETDWTFEFTNLPKYDSEGNEIEYTIEEVDVTGYTSDIEGFNITNTQETTEITGTKTWLDNDDATGMRPESITVQVLNGDEVVQEQEVKANDDGEWNYTFTDLPKYDKEGNEIAYTVEEIAPEGYEAIADGHDITNLRVGEVDISGEKAWVEVDEQYRPDSITVNLLANEDEEPVKTVEVSAETDWTFEFTNLPKFDSEGKEIKYTIEEVDVAGYTSDIEGFNITNTQETTELSGIKTWVDNDDATETRPQSITVQVLNGDEVVQEQEVSANDDGEWHYTFTDLPKYDKEGIEIEYTVNEVPVKGYETTVDGHDITNLRVGTTEVEVTKFWKDEQENRPEVIKVNLLQNGEFYEEYEVTKEDDWKLTITALPEFDENGVAYEYTVKEHDVPGYAADVDGFDITNTRSETKDIEITKTWLDDASEDRPESIEVELVRSITDGEKESVGIFTLTVEDDWKLEVTDLPAFNEDGKAYTYEIEEKAVDGYETTISGFDITNVRVGKTEVSGTKTWLDDESEDRPESITVYLLANGEQVDEVDVTAESNWTYEFTDLDKYDDQGVEIAYTVDEEAVAGYETSIEGNDITNLRVGKTEVSGTKTWLDDESEERPESITVNLLQNGEIIESQEVTADDNWTYSFTDLDEFDEEGVTYEYTIDEVTVDGYEPTINGNDITNLRVGTTEVSGTKTWLDDESEARPESITVYLLANGEQVDEVDVTAESNWTYEFTGLDKYDDQGVEITYTVDEEAVAGYEKSIEGNDITNLRVGTTEVSGTKTWKDDSSEERPDSIKVNLLQNGVVIDTVEVTAEDDWKYSFTDLDQYDNEGVAYEYEVKEQGVPGYKSEVDGFDITNTRSDLTSVVVTKGWLDDHSDDRPDSITVHLLQNGDIIETVQVTAAEDWTYEFTDLDAYDENGVAYEYTIEEEAVEGYETTIDGFDITNLRVGETEVSGTKTWEEDDPNDRPESITVNLLANGEQVGSQEVTADMDWTYAFTNLPAFDAEGKAIKYTVEEVEVPGYKTHIDGFDITNIWIPVDPEDPTEPEIPDDPKDPSKPEDPKEPSKPEDPKEPGKPEEPSEPASGDPESQDKGDQLPKTATNMYNMILIGTILLAGGVVLWLLSRRRDDTV